MNWFRRAEIGMLILDQNTRYFSQCTIFLTCSLVTLKNILEPLREITAKLQKHDLDIYEAFCNLDSAIDDVTSNRPNIDSRYPIWYQEMLRISKSARGEEKLPRIADCCKTIA